MSVNKIKLESLRYMKDKQGLILRGCGGDISEWVDGINRDFTKGNILLDGTKFTDVSVFDYKDETCILYPFTEDLKINLGKLSIWRVRTSEVFGGTWLTDFVEGHLGGFVSDTGITTGQAVRFSESGWYKSKSAEEIVAMQLFEPKLVVPKFDIFHKAIEDVLGVPVQTIEFGFSKDKLQQSFKEKVSNAEELIDKMLQEKIEFISRADQDKIYLHNEKLKGMLGGVSESEIYESPDFQCDQSGGYPVCLCVSWEKEIAWLKMRDISDTEGINTDKVEEMCADFGIKKCVDDEQFNKILEGLGEDAVQSAYIPTEEEGQGMKYEL